MATVLVVDDAPFMRMMLREIVEEAGHQVVGEAGSADEAVRLYRTLRPDVVTLDVVMPRVNGIAAAKEMLARDPRARIIMVSSLGQEEVVREALRSGARDYVIKPFQPDGVRECLERVLKG